jgi:hypothetical protein
MATTRMSTSLPSMFSATGTESWLSLDVPDNGFIIFVGPDWLVCVDGPVYSDSECKATRWPTKRSAQRALSRLRKQCKKSFARASVCEIREGVRLE